MKSLALVMLAALNLAAQNLTISQAHSNGTLAFSGAFTNGVLTIEQSSDLDAWFPLSNLFTVATTGTTSVPTAGFFRLNAANLSSGREGFTNLVKSYSLLTTIAGAGGSREAINKWSENFENGPATAALLSRPHIAMGDDAGNIYIADKDAHGIRKVLPDGTIFTVAGTGAAGDGPDSATPGTQVGLREPNGLWVRGDGTVYILDLANQKVRKFDTNGLVSKMFDVPGLIVGRGIWVNDDETLAYVCSGTAVKRWTSEGGLTDFSTGYSELGNLAMDPQGRLVVTDRGRHGVYRLDANGAKTRIAGNELTFSQTGGGDGGDALLTGLNGVRAIWFLPTGAYFLGTHAGSQMWYVDLQGKIHLFIHGVTHAHSGDGEYFFNPAVAKISQPRQITMMKNGDILVTEHDSGYVRKILFLPVN